MSNSRQATFKDRDALKDKIQLLDFGNSWVVEWSIHTKSGGYVSHEETFFDRLDAEEKYFKELANISKRHISKPIIKES